MMGCSIATLRWSITPTVVAVCAVLAVAVHARGEINGGESIEWIVDSSDSIGVYRLDGSRTDTDAAKRSGVWVSIELVAERSETLKGSPPTETTFQHNVRLESENADTPRFDDAEFLVFFHHSKTNETSVRFAVNLTTPATDGNGSTAFTRDFGVLKARKAIREVVDKRIALNRHVHVPMPRFDLQGYSSVGSGRVMMATPFGSEAFRTLYRGSGCYLIVPADADFKQQIMNDLYSPDVTGRTASAYYLSAYPGTETKWILESLLDDPGTTSRSRGKGLLTQTYDYYPVRAAAVSSLSQLGHAAKTPQLERLTGWNSPTGLSIIAVSLIVGLLVMGYLVRRLRRWRRKRAIAAGRSVPELRPITVQRWFRVTVIVALLSTGYIAGYLMLRTYTEWPNSYVKIGYPNSYRTYALSEHGAFPTKTQPAQRVPIQYQPTSESWTTELCRTFYPLERLELLIRGLDVWDG